MTDKPLHQTTKKPLLGFNGLSKQDRAYIRAMLCEDCGKFPADHPSKLCPACEAYLEHQR